MNQISKKEMAQFALRYVDDSLPGISRKRRGKSFSYYDAKGNLIKDKILIKRIKSIGIPPAYNHVWICPYDNGHIQAIGYDARNRKQYRYHNNWRAIRDQNKFEHIISFGEKLNEIRESVKKDLSKQDLSKEKVLAAVVKLLEVTLIRVGNEQYAKDNKSYGLTTLRSKHVEVQGHKITFEFMGKSKKKWNLQVNDRRIAAVAKRCAEIPGHELFKYVDKTGNKHDITSSHVNDYLHQVAGKEFTAKDFRTWAGTVLAAMALKELAAEGETATKKHVIQAIEKVAKQLGNTPSICRKCYIHPEIINAYLDGELIDTIQQEIDEKLKTNHAHLSEEEIKVLQFLKKRLG